MRLPPRQSTAEADLMIPFQLVSNIFPFSRSLDDMQSYIHLLWSYYLISANRFVFLAEVIFLFLIPTGCTEDYWWGRQVLHQSLIKVNIFNILTVINFRPFLVGVSSEIAICFYFYFYFLGCYRMVWKVVHHRKISKSLMLLSFLHKEKLHQNWHLTGGIVLLWNILLTGHCSSSSLLMFCQSMYHSTLAILSYNPFEFYGYVSLSVHLYLELQKRQLAGLGVRTVLAVFAFLLRYTNPIQVSQGFPISHPIEEDSNGTGKVLGSSNA